MKRILPCLVSALAGLAHAQSPKPWSVEVESGIAAPRYNNARVPNSSGDNLDLAGLIGRDWRAFGRVSLLYQDQKGGTWKLLYAPLRQSGTGFLSGVTSFTDVTFSGGAVDATYQFNSYRLTYRKQWKGGWAIGGTLKVRDAEIRLKQGNQTGSERNVGLVPLLNVYGEGPITRGLMYEVELDGLAGGPGRAIDFTARLKRELRPNSTIFIGVRVLEGGADVPKVYNFAWISYLTLGVTYRF